MKKRMSIILVVAQLFVMLSMISYAWDQPTHMVINSLAIEQFESIFGDNTKYINGPVNFEQAFDGLNVKYSTRLESTHTTQFETNTIESWITIGGSTADEPHYYMALRHFYDPLALTDNKHYLTDMSLLRVIGSAVNRSMPVEMDAREWGLTYIENPYSFNNAKKYYKYALELSELEESPEGSFHRDSFRMEERTFDTIEEVRSFYLGSAFRGLGETMHLMSDMSLPAHVRNDGHPIFDSVESNITGFNAAFYANNPMDQRMASMFLRIGENSETNALDLFHMVASYTNENFFSSETITGTDENGDTIYPVNGEKMYPSPLATNANLVKDGVGMFGENIYYGEFNGKQIPLARQSLLNKITSMTYTSYGISPEDAKEQAKILLPNAVRSSAEIMDLFFPTMKLEAMLGEPDTLEDKYEKEYEAYTLNANMIHDYAKDVEWNEPIAYSGPGKVLIYDGNEMVQDYSVNFENGKMTHILIEEEWVDDPVIFYTSRIGDVDYPKEAYGFVIDPDMSIQVVVDAGGRNFESEKMITSKKLIELSIEQYPAEAKMNEDTIFTTQDIGAYYEWYVDGELVGGDNDFIEMRQIFREEGIYDIEVEAYSKETDALVGEGAIETTVGGDLTLNVLPAEHMIAQVGDVVEIAYEVIGQLENMDELTFYWYYDEPGIGSFVGDNLQIMYEQPGNYHVSIHAADSLNKDVAVGDAILEVVEDTTSHNNNNQTSNENNNDSNYEKRMTWVLVSTDIKNYSKTDEGGEAYANISDGSLDCLKTYLGPTDNWYSPPMVNGESGGANFSWTSLNRHLEPGETLKIDVTGSITVDTCSYYNFYSIGMGFSSDRMYFDYTGDDLWSNTFWVERNGFESCSGYVTALVPSPDNVGDTMYISTGGNSGASITYNFEAQMY